MQQDPLFLFLLVAYHLYKVPPHPRSVGARAAIAAGGGDCYYINGTCCHCC